MQNLQAVIQQTRDLLQKYQPPDPAMVAVATQLDALAQGQPPTNMSIGRIIAYQMEPAPNAEIQGWCDDVLAVWQQVKKGS